MASREQSPESLALSGEMISTLQRNIHALARMRHELHLRERRQERVAETITGFVGSMGCIYFHVLLVGAWVVINLGVVPGVKPFDPFPFVMLAAFASVEAIFLTTFVLMTQNRMQRLSDQRAELDLQVGLLSEHEVTRLVRMVDAIARHLGVEEERGGDLQELKKDVQPEQVLGEIERAHEEEGMEGSHEPHGGHGPH